MSDAVSSKGALSRRTVLRAAGGVTATAAALSVSSVFGGVAEATIPSSPYFGLNKPYYDLFRSKLMHESHHAMQGFAFDNVNRRLFVAQIQNGSSGDDLCINQLSFSGNRMGSMHLPGAGHGVSIGVEAVGTSSYLWTECDSHSTGTDGRGTALARFKYVSGATPSVKKFLTGSRTITCATDPIHKRLAVRRSEGGRMHYSVYNLADAAAGNFGNPLAHFAQPALSESKVTFQGYTIYGQYLYTLDGTGQADAADINSHLTRIDMNTGKVVARVLTDAGKSLIYREPEGMAVYRTSGGQTRLYYGFASRSSLGNINRYANIFYKNVLIS